MLGARIMAPVLETRQISKGKKGYKDLPSHECFGLRGIGELSVGDHPETSLTTLQTPELDLNSDTRLACPLDIRLGNGDVLLIRLLGNHGQHGCLSRNQIDMHRRGWRLP